MSSTIRKAKLSDINDIYSILKIYSDKNIILERTKSEIETNLNHFFVSVASESISGVISYFDYGRNLKEIRSLAIKNSHTLSGIGSQLVQNIISILTKNKKVKIFVLTYSPIFFQKNNFKEVSKDSLPEKIWKDCNKCKNKVNCGETALIYQG